MVGNVRTFSTNGGKVTVNVMGAIFEANSTDNFIDTVSKCAYDGGIRGDYTVHIGSSSAEALGTNDTVPETFEGITEVHVKKLLTAGLADRIFSATPNTKVTINVMGAIFEANVTDFIRQNNQDIVFMGTGGRLQIFRYGYTFLPADGNPQTDAITVKGSVKNQAHMKNWFDCIRDRNKPNADVTAGHYSSMACHIGNIAYRTKNRAVWREEWNL